MALIEGEREIAAAIRDLQEYTELVQGIDSPTLLQVCATVQQWASRTVREKEAAEAERDQRKRELVTEIEQHIQCITRFNTHTGAVQQFLKEMWATLVDPVEDSDAENVAELCKRLLKAARDNRQALADALEAVGTERTAKESAERSLEQWYRLFHTSDVSIARTTLESYRNVAEQDLVIAEKLRAAKESAERELELIDNTLSRRPALAHCHTRAAKIELACSMAGKAEAAEALAAKNKEAWKSAEAEQERLKSVITKQADACHRIEQRLIEANKECEKWKSQVDTLTRLLFPLATGGGKE